MDDNVCSLQLKLSNALITLERVDRTFNMIVGWRDNGIHRKVKETIAALKAEPSNVIQIGDHQPEPVHYDLIQDAVKEAVREERS